MGAKLRGVRSPRRLNFVKWVPKRLALRIFRWLLQFLENLCAPELNVPLEFNNIKLHVESTGYIYVFCVDIKISSEYFPVEL